MRLNRVMVLLQHCTFTQIRSIYLQCFILKLTKGNNSKIRQKWVMVLVHCTSTHGDLFTYSLLCSGQSSVLKLTKGNYFKIKQKRVMVLVHCTLPIEIYLPKFHYTFRVMSRTKFSIRGDTSKTGQNRVMVLWHCTSPQWPLPLYEVSKGFQVMLRTRQRTDRRTRWWLYALPLGSIINLVLNLHEYDIIFIIYKNKNGIL
jgi:hypothetical protein